jgi:hypothetical protein
MSIVKIQVTAEDIATGQRGCVSACPVARALARVITSRAAIKVDGPTYPHGWAAKAYLPGGRRYEVPLPDAVSQFAFSFDDSEAFKPEPFEFDIDVPGELLEDES